MQPALREGLAAAGFAQVAVDYRLAPEAKLPAILEDVLDAFAWVHGAGARRFGFDGARVGVVGHSAGGYLTLLAGVHVRPRPRALVSFYGYGDVAAPWYAQPDPFYCAQPAVPEAAARAAVGTRPVAEGVPERMPFYLYCRQHGLWPREVVGLDPAREPRAFDRYCPARSVTAEYPPTLLLHGTADTDVPYAQSAEMAAALAAAGVAHELVTIVDGPHGFDRDARLEEHSAAGRALARALDFLARRV
jgi:acetyl esterase/lipase